jgi:hypothetical protein
MLRLAELSIRTARFKDARGLPAIVLSLSKALLPLATLAGLLLYPPDTWPKLMAGIQKLSALTSW